MAPLSPYPQRLPGTCRIHDDDVESVSTRRVPNGWVGRLVKSAAMVVALVSLAAWWDWGSPTSMENVVGTHPDRITSLAISEDGRWVASGGYHGSVVIWDPLRMQMERVLEGSDGPVHCLVG